MDRSDQRGFAIDDLSAEQVSELASALTDLDLVDAVVATNRQGADE